jgi:hypothetical protein
MAEPRYAELLTLPHNYAVVRLPDRRYPGVVIQRDSLATICARLAVEHVDVFDDRFGTA